MDCETQKTNTPQPRMAHMLVCLLSVHYGMAECAVVQCDCISRPKKSLLLCLSDSIRLIHDHMMCHFLQDSENGDGG